MPRPIESDSEEIGLILVPGFALMSFAAASEPFRAANILAGRDIYRLRTFGTAKEVRASSGALIETEALPAKAEALRTVFVCAGGQPGGWHVPDIVAALRRLAREGVRIGGISGGPYILAAAGLLDNREFTIHWEHAAMLSEAFPHLSPRQTRYVIDRDRLTCGGGIAPLDMSHAMIAERMGDAFARRVSDWYLHTEIGIPTGPQRASIAERYNVHHPALLTILAKMEATVEAPLSRRAMAASVSLSLRQVDRLFAEHLGTSFQNQYREIRLAYAKRLIQQSALSVSEIAFAAGFSTPSHFSRAIRKSFGQSPSQLRRASNSAKG
ncbi:GlxA family transcriptional regulator [Jiella marina]